MIGRRALVGGNMEKGQGHAPAIGVGVTGPVEGFSHGGPYPEFFFQLA